ncbi:hypothetical protein ACFZAS_43905, partial [Streptomyces lavendulae]
MDVDPLSDGPPPPGVVRTGRPSPGFTHIQRFDATRALQTFTVPEGVKRIHARCWGSGGAAYGHDRSTGGGGGFTFGDVDVEPGETLYVVVGDPYGYGGGGTQGSYGSRSGGGMSGL